MQITQKDLDICFALAREVENIRERIERLRALLSGSGVIIRETPGSTDGPRDKMAEGVASLVDMERDARHRIEAYLDHAGMVEKAIDGLGDPGQRMVLRLRYMDGLVWEEVARKAHYSKRWCEAMAAKGLAELGIEK